MEVEGNNDIWRLDAARGALERFTTDAANEFNARLLAGWDARCLFEDGDLVERPSSEVPSPSVSSVALPTTARAWRPSAWSPDGRFLLYERRIGLDRPVGAPGRSSRRAHPRSPEPSLPRPTASSRPTARWIAYTSDESGKTRGVRRSRFPGPAAKHADLHRGRGHGRAGAATVASSIYIALDERLMAVPLETSDGGDVAPGVGAGRAVRRRRGPLRCRPTRASSTWCAEDGQRFLLNAIAEQQAPPITVILNWQP